MAADSVLVARLDELIDRFNRGNLDLPDGFFDRRTQFRLNGTPFEAMLGRSPTDPLILMLTRGPAGYRFTLKAVRHAVPDARLERGAVSVAEKEGRTVLRVQCWLSGHFRGAGEPVHDLVDVEIAVLPSGTVSVAAVTIADDRLAAIREARLRA